jgi:hypothetical protein
MVGGALAAKRRKKMINQTLTANETLALTALIKEALSAMGGSRPSDFESDPFTWCEALTLVSYGWSKEAAAGTYGSLAEKGLIYLDRRDGDFIEEDAWRAMDSEWERFVEELAGRAGAAGGVE